MNDELKQILTGVIIFSLILFWVISKTSNKITDLPQDIQYDKLTN